jgi:hypothetical protein
MKMLFKSDWRSSICFAGFKNAWVGEVTLLVGIVAPAKWEAARAPQNGDPQMR